MIAGSIGKPIFICNINAIFIERTEKKSRRRTPCDGAVLMGVFRVQRRFGPVATGGGSAGSNGLDWNGIVIDDTNMYFDSLLMKTIPAGNSRGAGLGVGARSTSGYCPVVGNICVPDNTVK
jgi:hypothetical protein